MDASVGFEAWEGVSDGSFVVVYRVVQLVTIYMQVVRAAHASGDEAEDAFADFVRLLELQEVTASVDDFDGDI